MVLAKVKHLNKDSKLMLRYNNSYFIIFFIYNSIIINYALNLLLSSLLLYNH